MFIVGFFKYALYYNSMYTAPYTVNPLKTGTTGSPNRILQFIGLYN